MYRNYYKEEPQMRSYFDERVVKLMKKRGMLMENESPKQALERAVKALNEVEENFPYPWENFSQITLNYIDKK